MTTYLTLGAVSYNTAGAVAATGIGETTIKRAIAEGDLVAHYVGKKIVLRAVDLDEWIQSLPSSGGRPYVPSGALPGQTKRSAAYNSRRP